MNSRTEGELYAAAAGIDPGISPARAAIRIRAMVNAMEAGAGAYSREMFVAIMATCDVTIAAIDAHAAPPREPPLLMPPADAAEAGQP